MAVLGKRVRPGGCKDTVIIETMTTDEASRKQSRYKRNANKNRGCENTDVYVPSHSTRVNVRQSPLHDVNGRP